MKGKRKLTQRILSLMMVFAMVMGMLLEPVQIYAAKPGQDAGRTKVALTDPQQPDGNGGSTEQGGTSGGDSGSGNQGGSVTTPEKKQYTVSVAVDGNEKESYKPSEIVKFKATVMEDGKTEVQGASVIWDCIGEGTITQDGVLTINSDIAQDITITVNASYTPDGETTPVVGSKSISIIAPRYTISGMVQTDSGVAIPDVAVSVDNKQTEIVTDENGEYTISDLTKGSYSLTFARNGFLAPAAQSVTIDTGDISKQNVTMNLDTVNFPLTVSSGKNSLVVDESTKLTYSQQVLAETEITNIAYSSTNSNISISDDKVKGLSKVEGATVKAVLHTKYGEIVRENATSIDVFPRNTSVELEVKTDTGLFENIRSITLNAKVKTADVGGDVGKYLSSGKVKFTVEQLADTQLGIEPSTKTYEVSIGKNNTATYKLSKRRFNFAGKIKFTAEYIGEENKYNTSDTFAEHNYETDPIVFENAEGKDIKGNVNVTYGDTYSVFVAKADDETVKAITKNANVAVVSEANSERKGYAKFVIETVSAESTEITFVKEATVDGQTEELRTNLKVKVEQKEISIDAAKVEMTYGKIYDGQNEIDSKNDKDDKITFDSLPIAEGEVVGADDIQVSVNTEIRGTLIADEDTDLINVGSKKLKVELKQSNFCLTGTKSNNYKLKDTTIKIPAQVTINQRPVQVNVKNASREYGHAINNGIGNEVIYEFPKDPEGKPVPWVEVEKETENNTGIIEKDAVTIPEWNNALLESGVNFAGNMAVPGKYQEVLSVDCTKFWQDAAKANNYEFKIAKGTLEITEESIKDIAKYVNLQDASPNPTMYIKDGKIWVKAKGGKLELKAYENKLYNVVKLIAIGNEPVKADLTNTGYEFNVDLKDAEIKSLTLQLVNTKNTENTENQAASQTFTYDISLDASVPTVSISNIKGGATTLEQLVSMITFGNYKQEKYEATVTVGNDETTSGTKEWQYAILPVERDIKDGKDLQSYFDEKAASGDVEWNKETANLEKSITITRQAEDSEEFVANNYVVLVQPFDNVNNTNVYTSMGFILESNQPKVEITSPDNWKDIYDGDVNLNAVVSDVKRHMEDGTYASVSGINKVYYQIGIGEDVDKAEEKILFPTEENQVPDHYTLEELRKAEDMVLPFTVPAAEFNSNNVVVKVTVEDNAGNKTTVEKPLKIDITKPEVTVKYETEATEDYAPYYKEERTAIITVKERNIQANNSAQLSFYLKREKESKAERYNLSGLDELIGVTVEKIGDVFYEDTQSDVAPDEAYKYTDDRTITVRVKFGTENVDDKYDFDVQCKDGAGNTNTEDNQSYFVIDQTAPELKVTYSTVDETEVAVPFEEAQRLYRNKAISAHVTIEEHNFALDGEEVPVDVKVETTKVGANETIPDYNKREKENSKDVWGTNGDVRTSTYTFNSDANYTHSITYTDLAGNIVTYGPGYFTVDKTQPTGTVEIKGFGFWESLLEKITFGLFSPSTVDVVMTGADHTSPVNPVQFARFHDQMTRDDLENYNGWSSASQEKPESAAFSVSPDEQFIVYTKVTDYAGNYQYFSSDGMIVDSTKPAPVVTITNLSQAQNGIFNENVTLQIDVEDPTAGETYSGLEKVWYTVSAAGNVTTSETIELLNNSGNKVQGNKTFSKVITVPADVYNSNDVKVQAFATDFSGNQGDSEITELKIDVTNPTISVSWDLNNPLNGRYYKDTRTATVTVTDRNFDPNNVRFNITNTDGTSANIGGWSSSSNIGVSDTATSTCQVSFPADGDYTFTLGCTDLAGNSGEYGQTDEFTIDKTIPVMTVSYDNNNARNGNFFKETRTATVTIREHNFNAADVRAAITASLEGSGISTPSISGFSGSGDVHTATVNYSTDGDYTFDIDYTDMAGNAAADYTQDSFTVDLTAPELEITDVEDRSANNDAVAPKVEATDVNYDAKGVTMTLTGANNGNVEVGKVVSAIQNGQSMKFNDFARTEEMDDLYKLQAKAVDKAGNETQKEIMFSVNRYGSVFILDNDTKDWLKTGDEGYTYIREEKEVGIREINVDAIESRSITVNRDGDLASLKENTDFTVKNSGSDAQWKEAHYVIAKNNFEEEGNYTVILNTQDKAQNSMNNTSVKKANKNLPIEFAVDKTAPTVVVSGVEDDAQYRAAERAMIVDAKDNLALTKVSISIDGEKTVYDGEELLKDNGVIETAVASANRWQNIEITAEDAAGNVLGQSEKALEGEPVVLRVLVTPNIVIQYYMNKPLFYGSIAAIVIMAGLIIFLVAKKKKG